MRQNLCTNPAAKNNTTGWAGSGTPVRATDFPTPDCPRSTGVRASTSGFIQTAPAACAPGDVFTVSFYEHNGSAAFQFGRTAYVCYTRSTGGDVFPQTWNTGNLGDIGVVLRTSFTTDPAPADATGIYVLWDSLAVGLGMTGVLLEKVGALDTYADGDTSGWVWDDPLNPGNSSSSEAPATAEGTVDLGLDLAVAATGAAPAEGAAGAGIGLAVASQGAARAEGTVALSLGLAVTSTGARESLGAAALGIGLNVVSAGHRASLGASALGLNLAVAARGLNGTSGREVRPFPYVPRSGSGFPWAPRAVKSFQEVTEP